MKKILALTAAFCLFLGMVPAWAGETAFRAAWMTTVYNTDFPTVKGDATAQKQEFCDKLDALQAMGINAVIVQVRPKCDALYQSAINPWSEVLTGVAGQDPGYDPLAYMVEEAHKRGMELHAWLNPYRVTTSGTDLTVLAENSPARLHPEWVITYNNALYLDPANSEVREYLCKTVAEIVENYDVDGIHFDDYFYPSNYPLTDGQGRDGAQAQTRRQDVNTLIRKVYETIQSIDPTVRFGISPVGIWKNSTSDASGSATTGFEGYYSLYADALTWAKGGYVDYLAPQLYWETGRSDANYETLVKWWSDSLQGTGVDLYVGQGIYKDEVAAELGKQLDINEKYNVSGSLFYSTRDLLADRQGAAVALKARFDGGKTSGSVSSGDNGTSQTTDGVLILSELPRTATASRPAVEVDGSAVNMEAYNLDGYTYFKLRDVAAALNGTQKSFAVSWDDTKRLISVTTGMAYTLAGGELTPGDGTAKSAIACRITLMVNGQEVYMTAYNINGNNYIKLREMGSALGFAVDWQETRQVIAVGTK